MHFLLNLQTESAHVISVVCCHVKHLKQSSNMEYDWSDQHCSSAYQTSQATPQTPACLFFSQVQLLQVQQSSMESETQRHLEKNIQDFKSKIQVCLRCNVYCAWRDGVMNGLMDGWSDGVMDGWLMYWWGVCITGNGALTEVFGGAAGWVWLQISDTQDGWWDQLPFSSHPQCSCITSCFLILWFSGYIWIWIWYFRDFCVFGLLINTCLIDSSATHIRL